jgi:signal transduction histidine kinase
MSPSMNAVTDFFVRQIVAVFFFYGLAFFVMGLALLFVGRRTSQLRFALAVVPLAAFGLLHATHEWYEMFQKIGAATGAPPPGVVEESVRLLLLATSFVALLVFALVLLTGAGTPHRKIYLPVLAILLLWLVGTLLLAFRFQLTPVAAIGLGDSLSRYTIGIPAALLGVWALMAQQRIFREQDMPQYGRDLVWAAAALLLYGVIGQIFVKESILFPSHVFSQANFLDWFGIPVQLFRAIMAAALTFFLLRALRAFDVEERRRLEQANQAKLAAQTAALDAERRTGRQMEQLNYELRLAAHKLSLLLDLSNLLDAPLPLPQRLDAALRRIVESLPFSEAGMILLVPAAAPSAGAAGSMAVTTSHNGQPNDGLGPQRQRPHMAAITGFDAMQEDECSPEESLAEALGRQSISQARPLCLHTDNRIMEFELDVPPESHECRRHISPTRAIALPLMTSARVIGSLVLARCPAEAYRLASSEPALMAGIAQQLGLSIANALLQEQAQVREQVLGELLHQVVGAQEAERQRIARELHDATGQSLTAISLGLRGVENYLVQSTLGDDPRVLIHQVKELRSFGQNALGELRNLISDLRPPQLDDLGLAAALRWYVQAYAQRRNIAAQFRVEGDDSRLPPEYRTVLFRIAQEALTNIAKHAVATSAEVVLLVEPHLVRLDVSDDGRGFDPRLVAQLETDRQAGWGLVGIRERALLLGGESRIDTAPGAGTHLQVTVPLPAEIGAGPVSQGVEPVEPAEEDWDR